MRRGLFVGTAMLLASMSAAMGHDVPQSQVPSVIINSFQKAFPDATDVEWETKGSDYKVEFEGSGSKYDQSALYNKDGVMIRHKEDVASNSLPTKVMETIKKHYPKYIVDEAEKITEGSKTSFKIELKSGKEELKVTIDNDGNVVR